MKLSRRTLLAAVAALLLVAAPSLVDRTPRGDVQPQVLAGEISYVSRDADAFQFTATAGDDDLGVLHRGRASFATGGAEIIDCTRGEECVHADRPTRGCLVPLTSGARAEIGVMRVHTPNGSYDAVGWVRCLSEPTTDHLP